MIYLFWAVVVVATYIITYYIGKTIARLEVRGEIEAMRANLDEQTKDFLKTVHEEDTNTTNVSMPVLTELDRKIGAALQASTAAGDVQQTGPGEPKKAD